VLRTQLLLVVAVRERLPRIQWTQVPTVLLQVLMRLVLQLAVVVADIKTVNQMGATVVAVAVLAGILTVSLLVRLAQVQRNRVSLAV
jgi:hypothetical protein